MTAVERWQRSPTLALGRLSMKSLPLFVVALTVIQGCSTISGKVTSLPSPEILSPPKGTTVHIGNASWYGPGFHGRTTASGSAFDETKMTAAHRTLPFGSKAKVTNLSTGKSVEVEINDRGPYVGNRVMDLSERAAALLGITKTGLGQVVIRARLAQAGNARAG